MKIYGSLNAILPQYGTKICAILTKSHKHTEGKGESTLGLSPPSLPSASRTTPQELQFMVPPVFFQRCIFCEYRTNIVVTLDQVYVLQGGKMACKIHYP